MNPENNITLPSKSTLPTTPRHTAPILGGFLTHDDLWTLAYRRQRLVCTSENLPYDDSLLDKSRKDDVPLVYNSITGTGYQSNVKSYDRYQTSLRINRKKINSQYKPTSPNRTGTELHGFSTKSKSRLRFQAVNAADEIISQFCLTYADEWPDNGKECKRQLNLFLKRLRKSLLIELKYIWIGEFQTRGAPHFHIFLNLPVTPFFQTRMADIWHSIAGVSEEKHAKFHAHPKNFIPWDMGNASYLCKYLDKDHQKVIPPGFGSFGRWWGSSNNLKPVIQATVTPDELELFTVGHDKPAEFLQRQLCRYDEKCNSRSTVRKTPQSRTILTGAKIFTQLLDYLHKPPTGWYPEKLLRSKTNEARQ